MLLFILLHISYSALSFQTAWMMFNVTLVLCLVHGVRSATDGVVSCQTGPVPTRSRANVTCLFGTDVFREKHDFIVEKYRNRLTESDPGMAGEKAI